MQLNFSSNAQIIFFGREDGYMMSFQRDKENEFMAGAHTQTHPHTAAAAATATRRLLVEGIVKRARSVAASCNASIARSNPSVVYWLTCKSLQVMGNWAC